MGEDWMELVKWKVCDGRAYQLLPDLYLQNTFAHQSNMSVAKVGFVFFKMFEKDST